MASLVVYSFVAVIFVHIFAQSSCKSVLQIKPGGSIQFRAVGASLKLNCTLQSTKNFTLVWTFNYKMQAVKTHVTSKGNSISNLLTIRKLGLEHRGSYMCSTVDAKSHTRYFNKTVQIEVGYPPPVPPCPTLNYIIGSPPTNMQIEYTVPSSRASYPMNVKLLFGKLSDSFFCCNTSSPEFKLVEQQTLSVPNKYGTTFKSDVSKFLRMFSSGDNLETLCANVVLQNAFGNTECIFSSSWLVFDYAQCGLVENLRVLQRNKTSLMVAWSTPLPIINTSRYAWYYHVWCSPDCGGKKLVNGSPRFTVYNSTVRFLEPNTNYTIKVSCMLDFKKNITLKAAYITTKTLEDVPLTAPRISELHWLSSKMSSENLTAVLIWKYDKTNLRGNLKCYLISFQNKDTERSAFRKCILPESLHVEIPGLPNANYSVSIKACTGGGCGKSSPTATLPAKIYVTAAKNKKKFNINKTTLKVILPIIVLVFVCCCVVIVMVIRRNNTQNERDLPGEIEPTDENADDSSSRKQDNNYSTVNLGFLSGSTNDIQKRSSAASSFESTSSEL